MNTEISKVESRYKVDNWSLFDNEGYLKYTIYENSITDNKGKCILSSNIKKITFEFPENKLSVSDDVTTFILTLPRPETDESIYGIGLNTPRAKSSTCRYDNHNPFEIYHDKYLLLYFTPHSTIINAHKLDYCNIYTSRACLDMNF